MNPWMFLSLWVGSQSAHFGFAAYSFSQSGTPKRPKRIGSALASVIAGLLPALTLILFIYVFVIGRSSNVAQLAGGTEFHYWSVWFHAWPLLFFSNPISFFALIVIAVLPPYPPRYWSSFVSRLGAVAAAAFAWYTVVTFFPDA